MSRIAFERSCEAFYRGHAELEQMTDVSAQVAESKRMHEQFLSTLELMRGDMRGPDVEEALGKVAAFRAKAETCRVVQRHILELPAEVLAEENELLTHLNYSTVVHSATTHYSEPSLAAITKSIEEGDGMVRAHLAKGLERRKVLERFTRECRKVCRWSQEQYANLEAMGDDAVLVQQFAVALSSDHYQTMQNNMKALADCLNEQLCMCVKARRLLAEAQALWVFLLVAVLERVQQAVVDVDPRREAPLEVTLNRYAQTPTKLLRFKMELDDYLHQTGRAASSKVEISLPRDEYQLLSEQQAGMVERMRLSKKAFGCLRDTLLTRLTFAATDEPLRANIQSRDQEFLHHHVALTAWTREQRQERDNLWRRLNEKVEDLGFVVKRLQTCTDV